MKLSRLFMLLLALPLVFAACEPTPDVDDPKPVLALTSSETMNFGAEGGEGTITYTLDNAVEGTELQAVSEAEWVVAVAGDKVRVTVEANDGEAREAKVVVSYGKLSFEVTIKQAAKPVKEYLYNETMAYAERVDLRDYGFPLNYYLIAFYSADGNILMGTVLVGPEGESILSAGSYTAANGGLMMEGFELYVGDTEEYFFEGGDGTIVVGGDINGYTFDIDITNAEGQNFHFTYEGVVEAMDPTVGLPTEEVDMVAECFEAEYYGTQYSTTHNYYVLLSDKGFDENGMLLPGGYYFKIDLFGVEPVIDEEGYLHIPQGTYNLDDNGDNADWEIGYLWSFCMKMNEQGGGYEFRENYDSAKLVVSENGMYGEIVIKSGLFAITFEGEPKFYVGN